ncbi:hypothetical protein ACFX2C_042616 [Malus domestica]
MSVQTAASAVSSPDHAAEKWFSVPELRLRDHRFTVPLDYSVDRTASPKISVFAREVVSVSKEEQQLPYLLYLQGGLGSEAPDQLNPVDGYVKQDEGRVDEAPRAFQSAPPRHSWPRHRSRYIQRERARDTWRRSNGRRKNFIAVEAELAAAKKASTNKESGKSSVLLDVKPWDDESDMKKLDEAVRSVEMEGLFWGASKLASVGYGIKKLQIMLTIVDDLVSVDDLIEDQLTVEPPHRQHQHGQCTSGLKAQQQRRHRQLRGRVSEAPFLQVQKRGPVAKRTPGPTTLLHNASVATTPASTSSLHLLNPAPGLSTPPRQVHLHHCRIVPKQKLVPARFEVRMYLGMPWWLL